MITHHPSHASAAPQTSVLSLPPVILIADDDRNVRMLLKAALEFDRCRVLSAASGPEALAFAQASMPDLLVTDVRMPGLDGFGLIEAVRRLYPDLPVVIASGDASYRDRPLTEVAADHSVAAVLAKPFHLVDLYQAVRRAIRPSGATLEGPSREHAATPAFAPALRPGAGRAAATPHPAGQHLRSA